MVVYEENEMEKFRTQDVMEQIRKEITDKGLNYSQLNYITPYHNKLIERIKTKEDIIIFGAGVYGTKVLDDLLNHKIDTIRCFCDNKNAGSKIEGYEVLSVARSKELYPDGTYVVTPKWYENEIVEQLIDMGISIKNIIIFTVEETGLINL